MEQGGRPFSGQRRHRGETRVKMLLFSYGVEKKGEAVAEMNV